MYNIISLLIHRLFSAQRQHTTSDKSRAEAWEDAKVFKQHCLLPALVISTIHGWLYYRTPVN